MYINTRKSLSLNQIINSKVNKVIDQRSEVINTTNDGGGDVMKNYKTS